MKLETKTKVKKVINDFVLPTCYSTHVEYLNYFSDIQGYSLKTPPKENVFSVISEIYVCIFNREKYDYNKTLIKYVDYLIEYNNFVGDKYQLLKDVKKILDTQIFSMETFLAIGLKEADTYLNRKNVKVLENIFKTYILEGVNEIRTQPNKNISN